MFLANARHLLDSFRRLLPPVLRNFNKGCCPNGYNYEEENRYIHENFPSYPNLSIDYGILEKSPNVCVMCCDFG